jgi:hypothetical protein
MIRALSCLAAAILAVAPAFAQSEESAPATGGDLYRGGSSVLVDTPGLRDVFSAGERIDLASPISGAAHLAGRRIETKGDIGGALYAFGQDIRVEAPVAGSASLAGYDVEILGAVGGNLRAAGRNVALRAPVEGAALIAGDTVEIDAAIAGDAAITADTLTFGEGATIGGRLTLYSDADDPIAVPESVIPADRIDREPLGDRPMYERMTGPGAAALLAAFVIGVLVLAAFATIAAAVAPRGMARAGEVVSEGRFRALAYGFLTQATLIGAAILLVLTIVGAILSPFVILASVLLGFVGYLVGVYLLGDWVVTRFGALEADTLPEHALAALAGALFASLLTLLPFVGWLVFIALSLTGVGAMTIARLRPRYGV